MKNILKKGIVIIGILVVLFIFYNTVFYAEKENSFYEILPIKKGNITTTTLATGKVLPRDEVLIKPQISGIISEILKSAGDYVEKGDIIATVKVVPEISILSAAESRVRIAKISLKQIENDYNRQKELFDNGVITEEEMDKSEADFNKAIEEVANSEESLEIIKTGISKNTVQYSNTQIRSTISGMILDIPIKVGNSVIQANNFNDGTTIATIANMNDMVFMGKIDETEVEELYIGMPIKLRVGAIKKQKFDAKLEYISPKSIDENGAILFEIKASTRIPNTTLVRAGYSANAEIVLAEAKEILKIPERAINFQNDSAFVYVFLEEDSENHIVEKRLITIGISDGIEIEVKSGLSLTDKIRGNEIINR